MTAYKKRAGFTLIELMIAVGILAVLAAIAIPIYTQHVVRTNRAEAKTILSNTAQAFERCYSRFGSYNDGNCAPAQAAFYPVESEGGHYQISQPTGNDLTATSFTLTAAPQGSQATRDTECANFTLQHNGVRGVSGSGTVDDCW